MAPYKCNNTQSVTNRRLNGLRLVLRATGGITVYQVKQMSGKEEEGLYIFVVVCMLDIVYVCLVKRLKLALLLQANCLLLSFLSYTLTQYY